MLVAEKRVLLAEVYVAPPCRAFLRVRERFNYLTVWYWLSRTFGDSPFAFNVACKLCVLFEETR